MLALDGHLRRWPCELSAFAGTNLKPPRRLRRVVSVPGPRSQVPGRMHALLGASDQNKRVRRYAYDELIFLKALGRP